MIVDLSLLSIVSDGALIAYDLATIWPLSDSKPHAPMKLSGTRTVQLLKVWRYEERTLLLYSRVDGFNTVFKLLEPIATVRTTISSNMTHVAD